MNEERIYFKRKLPHYQPPNASFFITFRLANSLPRHIVAQLKEEYKTALKEIGRSKVLSYEEQKKYFSRFDKYLDRVEHGPTWLQDDRISGIVAETLHCWNGRRYDLVCYCIMPNHVHLVIDRVQVNDLSYNLLRAGRSSKLSYTLSGILHSIKRYTAREANRVLHRSGPFWQHESYDHVIRDRKELERIIGYVLNNPMKAGLVDDWQKWKSCFVRREIL